MLELAPGTWWGPEDATVVTAPPALVGGDARLREELAAEVARVRLAGRACLVLLGDDPAPTRDSAGDRADLAAAAVAAVGPDDVAGWLTMRDPLAAARAAGGGDVAATLAALHHLLLGHGAAADALREAGADVVGTSVHLEVTRPADPTAVPDLDAAHDLDLMSNHLVLGPLLDGSYPLEARAASGLATWPHVLAGDLVAVRRGLDVLLVEHAGTRTVRRGAGEGPARPAGVPGAEDAWLVHRQDTAGGRTADPTGLYEVLAALDNAYQGVPLLAAVATGQGEVGHGAGLADHEAAAREAADDGADVRGLVVLER